MSRKFVMKNSELEVEKLVKYLDRPLRDFHSAEVSMIQWYLQSISSKREQNFSKWGRRRLKTFHRNEAWNRIFSKSTFNKIPKPYQICYFDLTTPTFKGKIRFRGYINIAQIAPQSFRILVTCDLKCCHRFDQFSRIINDTIVQSKSIAKSCPVESDLSSLHWRWGSDLSNFTLKCQSCDLWLLEWLN